MATDKKGFILYADQKDLFDQLPNDKAGELIKHIFSYVNDENPESKDIIVNLAFTPIKQQLKRDLDKWEGIKESRSKAGKASAEARRLKAEQTSTNPTSVKSVEQSSTNPTVNDTVNVTVNVKDKEINNNTALPFSFMNSFIKLGADKKLVSDWLKVRKTKKLTNTETAFKGLVKEFDKSPKSINEILTQCCENSWGGFKASWKAQETNNEQKPTIATWGKKK